jgi:NADPH-dependent 2,4-dienoyl-CoA reductase/sulfur reductase-like enzyme
MRPDSFYQAQNIDLKLGADVNAIDVRSREVALDDGSRLAFDHLLLATGFEPVRSGRRSLGQINPECTRCDH